MEDTFQKFFEASKKLLQRYVETRLRLIKLDISQRLARALSLFFVLIIAFLLLFFVIMFLGMVLAYAIADASGSYTLGFSVSALLFLALLALVMGFRKSWIERPLTTLLINELTKDDQDDEEDGTNTDEKE